MALAMRGFILVAPKPNTVQILSCKYFLVAKLQTQHDRKHGRSISHSIITRVDKKPISKGGGGQTNGTNSADKPQVSDSSSSTQRDGQKSKGDANNTPPKTSGDTNSD